MDPDPVPAMEAHAPEQQYMALAHKPCHTCRRSRLYCDRLYPHCRKCSTRGVECLGYGKLFLWTGAIASRGKLAGKTSSAAVCSSEKSKHAKEAQDLTFNCDNHCALKPKPKRTYLAARDSRGLREDEPHLSTESESRTLIDPSFKDSGPLQRRYFDYFSAQVCKDLVGHDLGRNPFRDLLAIISTNTLLQEVIVAASAAHMCSKARSWVCPSSFSRREAPKDVLMDALVAKQKALHLLPSAVQHMSSTGGDVLLLAVLFLVNVELLESGNRFWKPHLEAAAKILNLVEPLATLDETIRDYAMSDCVVYSILSLTFNPSRQTLYSQLNACQMLPILDKAANSYLCCPPEVMVILFTASQVRAPEAGEHISDDEANSVGLDLLERVQYVDVNGWALKYPEQNTTESRFLAGSAHQLAAYLYVLQAIPSLTHRIEDEACQTLIDGLHRILSQIKDDDSNFKATAWPTFVFGATSKRPEEQAWAMDRLRRITSVFPWGFVYTALDTLKVLWELPELERTSKSWVQTLRDLDINFLIV